MRIAHISDFHTRHHTYGHPAILKRRSREMPLLIERVVRDIGDQAPDVLVVTGDLVDTPFYGMTDPECLEQARKDQQLVRKTIDLIDCPVFYLFGNHDHPDVFKDVFFDQNPDVTIGGYRFISFYDEEVTDHFAERVGEEKKRFDHVLTDENTTPQIHLQHYMVWPENNKGYPHSYREASELKARIAASGKVVLSLSGHFHGGVDAFEDDATWFATSRAFCEPPHPYRIYNLEGNHVEQTEYALGFKSTNRALFLDIFGLQDPLRNDSTTRAATTDLRDDGWLLIGIATARESERACDEFVGELSALGFNLDAVVSRRSVKNAESEHYHRALDQLDIEASTSKAIVCTEHEAEIAKSAGIKVIGSDPANLIQTLGEATEH